MGLSILTLRGGKINKASNTIIFTGDNVCNSDNIDAISVKGAEKCTIFGAGINKVAKKLATFRNNIYLCTMIRLMVKHIRKPHSATMLLILDNGCANPLSLIHI